MSDTEKKLSRLDLNLLIPLSVLLKERNISRAAEQLCISQSGMSKTLHRLRELFDDPLFYRTNRGIIPTLRAQELELLLPDVLAALENIMKRSSFEPETNNKSFNISVPAILSHAITLPLINQLVKQAPNIRLNEQQITLNPLPLLESGALDFVVHFQKPIDDNFEATYLGQVIPVIYAKRDHPLFAEEVTLKDCLKYKFVEFLVKSGDQVLLENPLNKLLFGEKNVKTTIVTSSQMHILIEVMENSDYLFIGSNLLMTSKLINKQIKPIYKFPSKENKHFDLFLISHNRVINSEAHQWLKQMFISSSLELAKQYKNTTTL
ncbi:LysR family transcriptional regulator [Thalassotalea psychrophila]|uniref:LysR family transcriptional regulator n=1 Tax=Thalassotalea psychrophila TaxID=3065647 RepID=A0ABY9TNU7_9GAMM|nr:LysR family transcriptional regulator [Colwelliaceae bacterium SQ149]